MFSDLESTSPFVRRDDCCFPGFVVSRFGNLRTSVESAPSVVLCSPALVSVRVHSWLAPEILHSRNPCHPWLSGSSLTGVYSCPFVVEPENLKKFSLNPVEGISTTRVNVYN